MGEPRIKVLWIKDEYLDQILSGRKTVEIRVGYSNIARLRPGDLLRLNDQHLAHIRRVSTYRNFEELLMHEDPLAIAPALPPSQLLEEIRAIYPAEKEALGVVALEVAIV
jgi:ASC-1-like (ASCH) protein